MEKGLWSLPGGRLKAAVLIFTAISYIVVGIAHFTHEAFFVSIMPPWVPAHKAMVLLSGVFEILGGVGLLLRPTRKLAMWGILALLVAVYPANIHMAMNPELYAHLGPEIGLYARLPMQFVFMATVWWAARPDKLPVRSSAD